MKPVSLVASASLLLSHSKLARRRTQKRLCRRPPTRHPTRNGRREPPAGPGPNARKASDESGTADISWQTARDQKFAKFLRDNSGGMIRKAAIGIERKGVIQIELDKSVAPDDTLGLTKSVMAGARMDFPGQPITLKMFDPAGQPILTAKFRPDHGVSYQLAHGESSSAAPEQKTHRSQPARRPISRSTVLDRA